MSWMQSGYRTTLELSCPNQDCDKLTWGAPAYVGEAGCDLDREDDAYCPECGEKGRD